MNVLSNIKQYDLSSSEFEAELRRILGYWAEVVFDGPNARFHPKVDHANQAHSDAASGSVMYARILWAFSAGYRHSPTPRYLELADTTYQFIRQHFVDPEYGGVYWSLHPDNSPADDRKQIYAIAFTIYGLTEYYKINADQSVLALAKQLYACIEQYSMDTRYGGYIEALRRDWSPTDNLRLSTKDDNEKKTLNTHLHLLEAYTNLYSVWPDEPLKHRIVDILQLFERHFIDHQGHLTLFFDDKWQAKSSLQSFGHDVEASWLICEAAETINSGSLSDNIRQLSLRLARASMEGIDESGAMCYELNTAKSHLNAEKHWWVQAEAVVGFYRAGLLSRDSRYTASAQRTWQYITEYLIDQEKGEWYWGRDNNGQIMDHEDKAGFWKCPYHNSRCCLQMLQLLGR